MHRIVEYVNTTETITVWINCMVKRVCCYTRNKYVPHPCETDHWLNNDEENSII